jgi:hypothetical protein
MPISVGTYFISLGMYRNLFMWDLKFSQQWVVMKSINFSNITPCSPLSVTDVSKEHIASIFRVEEISSAKN